MQRYKIITDTVTYALKAKDILRRNGYKTTVERNNSGFGGKGCTFSVTVKGEISKIEGILRNAGVKINEIIKI